MGIPTLIGSAHTASDAASIDITSGIDSTYDEYMFVLTDIGPASNAELTFQVNAAGGSGFDETMTTTTFRAYHKEDDSAATLEYDSDRDQGQGTAYQLLGYGLGAGSDESAAGILHLFNPSSTTYVKHFYSRVNMYYSGDASMDWFVAGYINTTTAIDEISFKMSTGNFDGVIQMYGIA